MHNKNAGRASPRGHMGLGKMVRELDCKMDKLLEGQGYIMQHLRIARGERLAMAIKYADVLDAVRSQSSRITALRTLIKSLADTTSEAEWKELSDAVLANTAEVDAAINENTPGEEVPPVEGGSTGGVGGSTGGVPQV